MSTKRVYIFMKLENNSWLHSGLCLMPLDYPRLSYDGARVEPRGERCATQPQLLKKYPNLIGTHFYYLLNEGLGQIDNVKLRLQTSLSNLMITNKAQMKTNK